jgi:hypothetical protein
MVAYSFKYRFVGPIRAGLGIEHLNERGKIVIPGAAPKRQTIRPIGLRRHARPGNVLQLYHAMRTKQCFLIGEAICSEVIPMIIWVGEHDLIIQRGGKLLGCKQLESFAQEDGFADPDDMLSFWHEEHAGIEKFIGICIMWRASNG